MAFWATYSQDKQSWSASSDRFILKLKRIISMFRAISFCFKVILLKDLGKLQILKADHFVDGICNKVIQHRDFAERYKINVN
jgi:hypothetical protein